MLQSQIDSHFFRENPWGRGWAFNALFKKLLSNSLLSAISFHERKTEIVPSSSVCP